MTTNQDCQVLMVTTWQSKRLVSHIMTMLLEGGGLVRGVRIRTSLRFAVIAWIRPDTNRKPAFGYSFHGIEPLHYTFDDMFNKVDLRKPRRNPVALAREWQEFLDSGLLPTRAALARHLGISRARVSQVLNILKWPLHQQEDILAQGDPIRFKMLPSSDRK